MSNQQESPRGAVQNVLENFFAETRLARATELAQAARFTEAAAVLTESGRPPGNARELDLLARIAAQQGRFGEARQMWTQASQLEPHNPIYQQCLKSLTPMKQAVRIIATHEGKFWNFFAVAAVVLVIGALLFVLRK